MKPLYILAEKMSLIKKEIDSDFVEAMEAVLFFSKNDLDTDISELLANKLINKLEENLNRIYACKQKEKKKAHSSKEDNNTKEINNISSLRTQQKHIYECFEKLSKYIKLDGTQRFLLRISKEDKLLNNYSLFYYFAFHDSVFSENINTHLKILNTGFADNQLSEDIFNILLSISYDNERAIAVKDLIKLFPINKVKTLKSVVRDNSRFLSDLFYYYADNKIELREDLKEELFNKIFNRNSYIAKSNINVDVFINLLRNYYSEEKLKEEINKNNKISYPPLKNKIDYVCLKLADSLRIFSVMSLVKLLDEKKNLVNKNLFLSKIDIKDTINLIDLDYDSVKFSKMKNFISSVENRVDAECLSYLLSLNSNYISFIKPFYLKIRLEVKFSEDDKTSERVVNRGATHKI